MKPFPLEAVEASQCYFFENWLMKHKWVVLVTMQSEIYHQNYQSFYPSEPFTLDHIVMRHPVKDFGYTSKSDLSKILFYQVSKKENEWGRY